MKHSSFLVRADDPMDEIMRFGLSQEAVLLHEAKRSALKMGSHAGGVRRGNGTEDDEELAQAQDYPGVLSSLMRPRQGFQQSCDCRSQDGEER